MLLVVVILGLIAATNAGFLKVFKVFNEPDPVVAYGPIVHHHHHVNEPVQVFRVYNDHAGYHHHGGYHHQYEYGYNERYYHHHHHAGPYVDYYKK